MRHTVLYTCVMLSGTLALAQARSAPETGTTLVELKNAKAETVGRAELTDTPNGVIIRVDVSGLPAGVHAFHIHETGACDAPAFESAGGHFNPALARHGFEDPKGAHAGDLPNIHVPENGRVEIEMLAEGVTLKPGKSSLLDANGSALVIHADADDYATDPSGGAGSRLACGVIGQGERRTAAK